MIDRWNVPERLRRRTVGIAREFRREPTHSEALLWDALRGRRLDGIKFRRQQPIGSFVVDFFAPAERLIVEVDGAIHTNAEQRARDNDRQALLERLGLRMVRVTAEDVETDILSVLETIRESLTPRPSPSRGRGETKAPRRNSPSPPQWERGRGGEGP